MGITPQIMANHTFDKLFDMMDANDFPALKQAFDEGADVNMLNEYESATLLMCAAAYGKVESLQFFLDSKACLDIKDKNGKTALDWAQDSGRTECAELLISAALENDLIRVAQPKPVKASAWV